MRITLSYMPLEWWYRHLANGLAGRAAVDSLCWPLNERPGLALENDVAEYLRNRNAVPDCFVGSVGALYRGITDLPCPTAVWSDFLPGNEPYLPALRLFDVVFVTQKDSVQLLRQAGIRQVEWLPFGFDDAEGCDPLPEKLWDVGFVGSLVQPGSAARRREILDALEPICRMNDFRRPAFGADLYRTYAAAKMVVNVPVFGGLNMRTFEAMGCGALLLTEDVGNGQPDLFEEDKHLVVYRSVPELVEKVKYYLSHEDERAAIARRGMELVRAQHTYRHRAEAIIDRLQAGVTRERSRDAVTRVAAATHFYEWTRRPDLMLRMLRDPGIPFSSRIHLAARALRTMASLVKRGWN